MSLEIDKPAIIINLDQVKRNIQRMAHKARRQEIRFRPHFKTHQSAVIGELFRQEGVTEITVSSVDMALYFAGHGWDDITIAFPANVRQAKTINELARRIHLGLLVESSETVEALSRTLSTPIDVWIEIDDGSHRTGVAWDQPDEVLRVIKTAQGNGLIRVKGLLTHAGRIYHADSPADIMKIYSETVERMNVLRQTLSEQGYILELSVGDTPGCTLAADLGQVDEIRPGNFIFYDAQQMALGVCSAGDIAAVVACPVVAKYPERGEVAIYGGAVHFSKDTVENDDKVVFGLAATMNNQEREPSDPTWLSIVPGGYLTRLSQEHGIVQLPRSVIHDITTGDLLYIIPAHVCLTVSSLGEYYSTRGEFIPTLNKSH